MVLENHNLGMDIDYLDLSPGGTFFGVWTFADWDGWGAKIEEAKGKLDEVEEQIRTSSELTGKERHSLFGKLHKKREDLHHTREDAWELALNQAEDLVKETYYSVGAIDHGKPFHEAVEQFKVNQKTALSLYLKRSDKNDIANMFQDLWDDMQNKIQEIKRIRFEKQENQKNGWINRQIDGLSRLRHAQSKVEERINSIESNLEANEERLDSAYTEDYEERFRGWISQNETLLQETQESLNGINRKIADAENKLEEAKS